MGDRRGSARQADQRPCRLRSQLHRPLPTMPRLERLGSIAAHVSANAADQAAAQKRMYEAGFQWCASEEKVAAAKLGGGPMNRPPWPKGLSHESFVSESMGEKVGYCIYLPPGCAPQQPHRPPPRPTHTARALRPARRGVASHLPRGLPTSCSPQPTDAAA